MSVFRQLMMKEKYKLMPLTVVGSPTITDGVVSGFSSSNYLKIPSFYVDENQDFEQKISFTTGNIGNLQWLYGRTQNGKSLGIYLYTNGRLYVPFTEKDGTVYSIYPNYILSANTSYSLIISRKSGTLTATIYDIGGNILATANDYIPYSIISSISNFGVNISNNFAFEGSINFNNSYIKIGSTKYKLVAVPE